MTETLSDGIVIGIYGIQGVGKSYILKQIVAERIEWRVADGSQLIREVLDEKNQTMEYFEKQMTRVEKDNVRKAAIESAKQKPGITLIAGHCSFPSHVQSDNDASIKFNDVFTQADGAAYDVIFYLEKPLEEVVDQVQKDKERTRPLFDYSIDALRKWVEHEKAVLKAKCSEYGIALHIFRLDESNDYQHLISLIVDKVVVPASNRARVNSEQALISSIKAVPDADVYLLIDGDGTLCPQDTGEV